jgi:hypothetical protein
MPVVHQSPPVAAYGSGPGARGAHSIRLPAGLVVAAQAPTTGGTGPGTRFAAVGLRDAGSAVDAAAAGAHPVIAGRLRGAAALRVGLAGLAVVPAAGGTDPGLAAIPGRTGATAAPAMRRFGLRVNARVVADGQVVGTAALPGHAAGGHRSTREVTGATVDGVAQHIHADPAAVGQASHAGADAVPTKAALAVQAGATTGPAVARVRSHVETKAIATQGAFAARGALAPEPTLWAATAMLVAAQA